MSRRVRAPARRSFPWSGLDPDRRNAVFLIGGIAVVVAFSLALIAFGYYTDRIKPNHETVLHVGKSRYDYNFLKQRVKAEVSEGKINLSSQEAIPGVLATIEREAVLRETARRDGDAVSDAEMRAQIAQNVQMAPEATRNQVASALRARLLRTGLSLSQFENIARAQVAEAKIKAKIEGSIAVEAEQVFVRMIVTSAQSSAIQAKQRLDSGEGFVFVAAALSQDEKSKATGGDIGFIPRGALPPEVENVAFSIIGISDVIETKDKFYVIEAVAKETQPVSPEARQRVIDNTFTTKMTETRDAIGSHPSLTTGQVRRILSSVRAPGV